MYWKLEACVNKHGALKKLSRKQIQLKAKPCLTSEFAKMISHRNKFFMRKKCRPGNEVTKRLFNLFRNRINQNRIKKAKKDNFTTFFEENKNNMKKTWVGIKSIINTKHSSPNVSQMSLNGKVITNPNVISNTFNCFFASIRVSTNKEIPHMPNFFFKKLGLQYNLILAHVSNEEILEIINLLENKSTSIPINLLKVIPDLIMIHM